MATDISRQVIKWTRALCYLWNDNNFRTEGNTEHKPHGRIMSEQEMNPIQFPHPSNATFKFPPPRARCTVKCPGYARGRDIEVSNWSAHYFQLLEKIWPVPYPWEKSPQFTAFKRKNQVELRNKWAHQHLQVYYLGCWRQERGRGEGKQDFCHPDSQHPLPSTPQ